MRSVIAIMSLLISSIVLVISCEGNATQQNDLVSNEVAQNDTTEVLQAVLYHNLLDSLLNFAFKNQTLKVLKNGVVSHPLNLTMHNKPVEYYSVDSTSHRFRDVKYPKFLLEISIFEQHENSVKTVLFFETIGLFGEYWLTKNKQNKWQIDKYNFSRT